MSKGEDLQKVADVLAKAEADHLDDLQRLEEMSEEQILYLANAADLEDPETDGIEGECI